MPFAPGKPCSKCDSDQNCFRGLCKDPLVNDKTGFFYFIFDAKVPKRKKSENLFLDMNRSKRQTDRSRPPEIIYEK